MNERFCKLTRSSEGYSKNSIPNIIYVINIEGKTILICEALTISATLIKNNQKILHGVKGLVGFKFQAD